MKTPSMATIPLGPPLLTGSSHLPAYLDGTPFEGPGGPSYAYLVLLRVEVAAFHIPMAGHGYSSLWPYSSPWAGREARLLRTAVSRHPSLRSPDLPLPAMSPTAAAQPTSLNAMIRDAGRPQATDATVQSIASPAARGTIQFCPEALGALPRPSAGPEAADPKGSRSGTVWGCRTSRRRRVLGA